MTKNSGICLQGAGEGTGSLKGLVKSQGTPLCPDLFFKVLF